MSVPVCCTALRDLGLLLQAKRSRTLLVLGALFLHASDQCQLQHSMPATALAGSEGMRGTAGEQAGRLVSTLQWALQATDVRVVCASCEALAALAAQRHLFAPSSGGASAAGLVTA